VDFLFKYLLVPLALLAAYCGVFAYVSSRTLPRSVNPVFTGRLWDCLQIALAAVVLLVIVLRLTRPEQRLELRYAVQKIPPADYILLLLPLTPVVQYLFANQSMLSPADALVILACFALLTLVLVYAVPALLGALSSTRLLMSLGLAFVFSVCSMAVLSQSFSWFESGSLKVQLPFFIAVFLVAWFLLSLKNRKIMLLVVALYFAANSLSQYLTQAGAEEQTSTENRLQALVDERTPPLTPSIYLLVYDAYVGNETMLAYGIDNAAQEDYLRGQGFTLYPQAYSVGAETLESMSKVLNASTEGGGKRKSVSGGGAVQQALKSLGYTTYGIFPYDYMFRGVGSSYDVSLPETNTAAYVHMINAILMGEFRFDVGFEEQTLDQFVEKKIGILASLPSSPVFVYTHSTFPGHSQNSGACLPDETQLYAGRLASANLEMKQDVETILARDPGAIIIVAGDHGPYLTKNCTDTRKVYDLSEIDRLDIQDRFGSLLAVRWPSGEYDQYDDITVLQDLFPAVFAYLYQDGSFLELVDDPRIQNTRPTSGAEVIDGIISGGIDDGEPLFLSK
jgi:hypothetical protein